MLGTGTQLIRAYHNEGSRSTVIFEKMGSQGDRWQIADIPLGRINGEFTLAIGARKSYTAKADIAVDDINLLGCGLPQKPASGQCTQSQFKCSNGGCIDKSKNCDITDDCGDRSDESSCTNKYV